MKTGILDRLAALRKSMKDAGLNAYIIPTADPHLSEYPAACWKYREWISGFTGSAGTVVVTADKAGLWTDSRYFLQAEDQLQGTGIDLYRLKIEGTPSISGFLASELKAGDKVGLNGETYSISEAEDLGLALSRSSISLDTKAMLLDEIWTDRPALPATEVWEMPVERSGRSAKEKIELICKDLKEAGADCTVLSALDEVAWTFNIRALDVQYNPVAVSYAYISTKESVLFIDASRLGADVSSMLAAQGVKVMPYEAMKEYLKNIPSDSKVLLDKAHTNVAIFDSLPAGSTVVNAISPANMLKSVKSESEIKGYRSAVLKDGIAMTRFFMWLEDAMAKGERVTELGAADKLASFRAQQPGYICDSFAPISSYGPHGAVVHYSPTPETDVELRPDSLYLLDSGGQYNDGTTDITRTIALCANPTKQMKQDFTAALRGTIGIALCRFPAGLRGCLVDAFARKALWDMGVNYLHGTCHGIGHCLNVHEGPQSIRMEENPVILRAGMVMSDEPAMYRAGEYGIRTENMVLIKEVDKTDWGSFLGFETLTLCYIDLNLVDVAALLPAEKAWLNNYHAQVYKALAPHLDEKECVWLASKTKAVE